MSISDICRKLQSLMDSYTRKPFPAIAGLIMACSLAKRPGLSVMLSTSNVMAQLNCYGISTEDMPNGEPNKMNGYTKAIISEVYRALQEDAKIQSVINIGGVQVAGPTGAMTNTMPIKVIGTTT